MKNNAIFSIFFLLLIFISCQEINTNEPKMAPSDYLYSQRSYPHGKMDHKAYQKALNAKNAYIPIEKKVFDQKWTFKGPDNRSGRVTDIEMPVSDENTIYVGTASGGIYKSEDQAATWKPIFDNSKSLSIGDMAISKDNKVMYVGTGESNAGGGSIAYDGIGVYKSEDEGKNWKECGPSQIGSIGRVVIDPTDNDKVFIAGMGTLFANNSERGVFRSVDGGNVWEQVLFLSDSTGAIDLAMHPTDGNIIYASMWERIRRPHNRQYGGATSGVYQSIDGGDTWVELNNGLPTDDDIGRIGLAISESDPNILYAYYANAAGGLRAIFKTEDGGQNWTEKSIENISNVSFIYWFGKIFVNPTDPDDVYVTSLNMHRSVDGGDNWSEIFTRAHVDHHAMFVHPQNPSLVFNGNDGGVNLGEAPNFTSSEFKSGINCFQFYTCEIDPHDPTILYGGAQDNGTNRNINGTNQWESIFGGDGFRVLVDPFNQDQIYLEYQYGNIFGSTDGGESFYNASTGILGNLNWNTPIALDPNVSGILYSGSQNLYRSEDFGTSWDVISPTLVKSDNPQGILSFGTLTTIDVSSLNSDVIYVGTDDGSAWVTKDSGSSYANISEGLPNRWITSIVHDPNSESGVYVTVSGFRFGESDSHVFYSSDYGENWKAIGDNLPDIPVNDIIVDDIIMEALYVATDIGVFVSQDSGESWNLLGIELPNVPIIDLDYDAGSRKMVAASFGRGMYEYELPLTVSVQEDIPDLEISIYPNPVSSIVNIKSEHDIKSLHVYDLNGRNISSNYKSHQMDIRHLNSGNYLLRINTSQGEITKRIQKI